MAQDNRQQQQREQDQKPRTSEDEVAQAVAKLPKADIVPGDDFSGASRSKIANPAEGVHYALPGANAVKAMEDRGYVRNPPGRNPITGDLEPARTVGPMTGHVLMGCDMSIREREVAQDKKLRAALAVDLQNASKTPSVGEVDGVEQIKTITINRAERG